MKTVVIVDDEQDARSLLKEFISQYQEFSVIGEADNGVEAVQLINQLKPDTVFLDIQMPGLNGFEVLSQLLEIPEVIFSTAFDHYAIKAFEVHAVDYLLKPYGKKRFENALNRVLKNQESLIPLTEKLLSKGLTFPTKIILHKGARKIVVNINDIVHGEAYGDYTKIFTNKEEFLSVRGISNFMENLNPDSFLRVHRSYFIGKNHLVEIKKMGRYYYTVLSNNVELKIGDSYLVDVKKMIF